MLVNWIANESGKNVDLLIISTRLKFLQTSGIVNRENLSHV